MDFIINELIFYQLTTLGRVGAPLTVVHPSQNSGCAASPVQAIEQASHDVISECRYTFCIVRNSIVMVITSQYLVKFRNNLF